MEPDGLSCYGRGPRVEPRCSRVPIVRPVRRIGGGTRVRGGRRAEIASQLADDFRSPLNPAIEGAFFVYGPTHGSARRSLATSAEALRAARAAAEPEADLVELRLDTMDVPIPRPRSTAGAVPRSSTCRPAREGGHFEGSEEERLRILERAQRAGAEFVDVEWDAGFDRLIRATATDAASSSRATTSQARHRDLPALLAAMRATGAEVAKLAVTTSALVRPACRCSSAARARQRVLIGMGAAGVASRVLAGTVRDPLDLRRQRRRARAGVRRAAAAGVPLPPHSRRRRGLRRGRPAGRRTRCRRRCTTPGSPRSDSTPSTCRSKRATSTTSRAAPTRSAAGREHHDAVQAATCCRCSTRSTPTARPRSAPSTRSSMRDGRWIGTNTDVEGFLEPLRAADADAAGSARSILGAGGAARGGRHSRCGSEGAQVAIAARRAEAAAAVARRDRRRRSPRGRRAPASWDLLVNATPVGSPRARGRRPFDGPVRRPAGLRPGLRPGPDRR